MRFLILPLLCFQVLFLSGQETKICYDTNWNIVKCVDFTYYRLTDFKETNNIFNVKDYYKNGSLQMEGSYLDKDLLQKTGKFVYYYENGNKSSTENYSNSKLLGEYKEWYKDGQIKFEGEYRTENEELYNLNFWDESGKQLLINANGILYTKSDNGSYDKGSIKNGLKTGNWEGYDSLLKINYSENYEENKLIDGVSTDATNQKFPYNTLTIAPFPIKGANDLRKFVAEKTKIPRKIKSANLSFLIEINEKGDINNVRSENPIDEDLEREVIKTIKKYKDGFVSPKCRGVSCSRTLHLPIRIVSE